MLPTKFAKRACMHGSLSGKRARRSADAQPPQNRRSRTLQHRYTMLSLIIMNYDSQIVQTNRCGSGLLLNFCVTDGVLHLQRANSHVELLPHSLCHFLTLLAECAGSSKLLTGANMRNLSIISAGNGATPV